MQKWLIVHLIQFYSPLLAGHRWAKPSVLRGLEGGLIGEGKMWRYFLQAGERSDKPAACRKTGAQLSANSLPSDEVKLLSVGEEVRQTNTNIVFCPRKPRPGSPTLRFDLVDRGNNDADQLPVREAK